MKVKHGNAASSRQKPYDTPPPHSRQKYSVASVLLRDKRRTLKNAVLTVCLLSTSLAVSVICYQCQFLSRSLSVSIPCCQCYLLSGSLAVSVICCQHHLLSVSLAVRFTCCQCHLLSASLAVRFTCCQVHLLSVPFAVSVTCCQRHLLKCCRGWLDALPRQTATCCRLSGHTHCDIQAKTVQ